MIDESRPRPTEIFGIRLKTAIPRQKLARRVRSLDILIERFRTRGVKLYEFDGIDASLSLIPLSARRALDALGRKLSLEGYLELPLARRQQLAEAGSGQDVDLKAAEGAIAPVLARAPEIAAIPEPDAESVPALCLEVLGPQRPLPEKVWQSLSRLDRYALVKVCQKNRAERVEAAYSEIVGQSAASTHIRPEGGVHMVSVSEKAATTRRAVAECWITMSPDAFERLTREGKTSPKGDVLGTARLAGIMATKRTSDLIPLCHPLAITHVEVDFDEDPDGSRLRATCKVEVHAQTGVEMEAMVGANIAALTVYDMLKSIDRGMLIGPCRLLHKEGGRSGVFTANEPEPKAPESEDK